MKNGPRAGVASGVDFVAKATAAWEGAPPDWILALAEEASRTSAASVARRLGYSGSVVSQVFSRSYPGDLGRIEQAVRGAFMGDNVDCPVLGAIGRDRCVDEQRQPFRSSSAMRAQLFHRCNTPGRCPHSAATTKALAQGGDQS